MSSTSPRSHTYVVMLATVAALGGFLFGYDSGVINGAVEALQAAFHTDAAGTGFAVASVLLGCAVGALAAGNLADHFGRRPMMIATALIFLVNSLGAGAAQTDVVFNFWRLLGGFAVGAASVLAPTYIAEIAPPAIRGRLATLQQMGIVLGLFCSFLSNYLIAQAAGGASASFWLDQPAWRWMFWAEAIPATAFLVGSILIPESPRFLVARGKEQEAAAIFSRIGAGDPPELVAEVALSLGGQEKPRLTDILVPGTSRVRPIVWAGITLSVFQQLVGINVIFYYGATLWEAAGQSASSALRDNLITGGTNIGATLIAMALIDRLGRKPLLQIGSIGMTITLGILTAVFAQGKLDEAGNLKLSETAAQIGLIAANVYILSFGISWGPAVWAMLGEMFANRYRGAALSVAAGAQWLANFLVTITFPMMLKGIGLGGAYAIYTVAAVLSFLFVTRCLSETRGKALEEMGN